MTVAAKHLGPGTVKSVTLGNGATHTGLGVGGAVGPAPLANSGDLGLDGGRPDRAQPVLSDAGSDPTNGIQPVLDPAKVAGRSSSAPAGPTPGGQSAAVRPPAASA